MKSSAVLEHNPAGAVKAQKASLPISRTNGPGYERPERARTSHACEPCRERKTKCDGERPACRRCIHTGTTCHYGYGKGWRKRKTAEDLSATSKKLQRYETLLNDIAPMVPPEVRAMIDEVRQQELANAGASEANDSTASSVSSSLTPSLSADRERSGSGPTNRIPVTLPVPPLVTHQSRSQQSVPFDRVSESTSPHLAHHPKRELAYDDLSNSRLPSITPDGVLIENDSRDTSPNFPRPAVSASHVASEHLSPSTGSSRGSRSPEKSADDWARSDPSSAFGLNKSHHQYQPSVSFTPRLAV